MNNMTDLANIFSPSASYTIFTVAFAGLVGFALGFLLKSGVINKHKKRVLELEDEMLANHSRILDNEKEIARLKAEIARVSTSPGSSKAELKVS